MSSLQIQRRADAAMHEEYGCGFWRILPWKHSGPSDYGAGLAVIPPGSASEPHSHDEHEHFFVTSGAGRVVVDEESAPVASGDAVVVAPGQRHHFENSSDSEPLEIFCLWTMAPLESL